MEINKETMLGKILENDVNAIPILARHGLHTLSCPSELFLPLHRVAEARGIPIEYLLGDIKKSPTNSQKNIL